ncbi:MAG: methyltransferase domain-containing protein [Candidatus Eremiobacteraeota bacterium]|nr:methyltransferase domain-containing protein [Candidatus Eremiobacteraeota bacterium]
MREKLRKLVILFLTGRAKAMARRLIAHLPRGGAILDVGSGTGHVAAELRSEGGFDCTEADVADLSMGGTHPVIFDGVTLPFPDSSFETALLISVLQYSLAPVDLLREVRRVTRGPLLIVQPLYKGPCERFLLQGLDFLLGWCFFRLFRLLGLVSSGAASLESRRSYSLHLLEKDLTAAGLSVLLREQDSWPPFCRCLLICRGADRENTAVFSQKGE